MQTPQMQKATSFEVAFWLGICLTMSYFHGRMPTIIGAKAFHGPVRDGKEWFHFAIVVRHDLSASGCLAGTNPNGNNQPNLVVDRLQISVNAQRWRHRHCDCVNETRPASFSCGPSGGS